MRTSASGLYRPHKATKPSNYNGVNVSSIAFSDTHSDSALLTATPLNSHCNFLDGRAR